jgi:hypothetical protein
MLLRLRWLLLLLRLLCAGGQWVLLQRFNSALTPRRPLAHDVNVKLL